MLVVPVASSMPVEIRTPVQTSGRGISPPVFVVPVKVLISVPVPILSGGVQDSSARDIVRTILSFCVQLYWYESTRTLLESFKNIDSSQELLSAILVSEYENRRLSCETKIVLDGRV